MALSARFCCAIGEAENGVRPHETTLVCVHVSGTCEWASGLDSNIRRGTFIMQQWYGLHCNCAICIYIAYIYIIICIYIAYIYIYVYISVYMYITISEGQVAVS